MKKGLFLWALPEAQGGNIMIDERLTDDELVEASEYEEAYSNENVAHREEQEDPYSELVRKYNGDHKLAIFEYCYLNNIPFSEEVYNNITKGQDDGVFMKMPGIYVDSIEADFRFADITFFDQLKLENFEQIYSEEFRMLALSEDDKRNRQQIINIIGYDPFEKNPLEDKPQLYRDLTGMLTDNMRKDIPRAKAAVEVVIGYNNIRKYQDRVNQLINNGQLDEDTQKQLDKHLEMIAKIQASVSAVSEKNGFTNSRALGSNGRGMLSDVMNTIDEHMYDPGITNFYDIATSKSIEQISDISFKSMLNQIKLTGQEYVDIISEQNKIVREARSKMRELKEALRIAKSLIVKDKLIEQLRIEYKKKGISEEDIDEFINRELSMHETH